ncbi:hypothetical protein CTAYLR_000251 [Chrysophaeum taylorii]|uniref:CRAL-TRIO domain-containing protein n=1 Tax=Chrysophaeum taylorii TaxID=2483200 RepID=A0AAD7UEG3_9STRA|nr:hypothetical protein CTAYLR_000251 [Chrysophaeum taylorii]
MESSEEAVRSLLSAGLEGSLAETYCFGGDHELELAALLGRFAHARRGVAEKAVEFLEEDVRWREEVSAAGLRRQSARDVLGCEPRNVSRFYERRLLGLDALGRPVYYQNFQTLVVRQLMKEAPIEVLERYHIWEQERAVSLVDELERRRGYAGTGKMSVVMDVGGMTLRKHVNSDFLRFIKMIASIDQDHYPERMGVTFVVNAPRAFSVVWSVVKPWLDPRTAEKIRICSTEAQWRPAITEVLGASIAKALDDGVNLDDVAADEGARDISELASALLVSPESTDDDDVVLDVAWDHRPTTLRTDSSMRMMSADDDVFTDAKSPKPSEEELARELLVRPIFVCSLRVAQNAAHLGRRVYGLILVQFVCILGVVACTLAILSSSKNEAKRAPFLAILASLAAFPFGVLGAVGVRRRNPGLLGAHVFGTIALTTAFFALAVSYLAVALMTHQLGFFLGARGKSRERGEYLALGLACATVVVVGICLSVASSRLAARLRRALFKKLTVDDDDDDDDDHVEDQRPIDDGRSGAGPGDEDDGDDDDVVLDGAADKSGSPLHDRFTTSAPGSPRSNNKKKKKRKHKVERNVDVADAQLRVSLWWCSFVILLVGVAGISYGGVSTSYFVRRGIGASGFVPYLLLQSSVALVVIAMVGFLATSIDEQRESQTLPGDTTATRLRRLVDGDLRFVFELRLYRKLALANVALCVACAALAVSQTVSVASVVRRDGDHRPQVAKTAALALVIVAAIEALAVAALAVASRGARALVNVRRRKCRLRKQRLVEELRSSLFVKEGSPDRAAAARSHRSVASPRTKRRFFHIATAMRSRPSFSSLLRAAQPSAPLPREEVPTDRGLGGGEEKRDEPPYDEATELLTVAEASLDVEEDGSFASGFAHLGRGEKGAVAWATCMGLVHVFLDGTYAIFNVLVRKHGDDNNRGVPWFLVLWRAYGKVDARYRNSDPFIVTQVAALALVGGPACLCFAWATYERKPWRHALGVAVCLLQLWTLALYLGTEAHAGFHDCAPVTSFVYFWLGFVGLTLIRLLLPLPVLHNAITSLVRDNTLSTRWDNVQRRILQEVSLHVDATAHRAITLNITSPDRNNDQKYDDSDDAPMLRTPTVARSHSVPPGLNYS